MKIFYSNRIERLYQDLKLHLFSNSSPFAKRFLIVPTQAIKSWLTLRLAQDPDLGIAAGLDILFIDESFKKLQALLLDKEHHPILPHPLELTLAIEEKIRQVISNWPAISPLWQPLINYLKISSPQLTQRSEKRLASLSETLAKLFREYGKYGSEMIKQWANETGWQEALWDQIYKEHSWSYPAEAYSSLKMASPRIPDLQIHLFSLSFLVKSEFCFFEQISRFYPLYYYSLSPCCQFWSDLLSDKESQHLQKYWRRRGASLQQQQTLEHYLQESHPLLANWGKLGRKMAGMVEYMEPQVDAHYSLPESILSTNLYEMDHDFIDRELTDRPTSLLDRLHADILLMKDFNSEKISVSPDSSIQLHLAPNRQREVQILYHNLLGVIQAEKNVEPCDILVMAPDIKDYVPYIDQIFNASENPLDFQLMDLTTSPENSVMNLFWHLIHLAFYRWNAQEVKELFNFPSFQSKHRLNGEEVKQILQWMEETGIRWGKDSAHRNEFLYQRYGQKMTEDTEQGTWEQGFFSLLQELIMEDPAQASCVDSGQAILLGKWISLLRSLRNDLKKFNDGTVKTYPEWIDALKWLIDLYIATEEKEWVEEQEDLIDRLNEFSQAARSACQPVSFVALKKHLESFLNQQTFSYREHHLQAVKFCSMLPMRSIPAKVIALLGMDENGYPRKEDRTSLNLMKQYSSSCDFCPSRADYDRYLFLETLLSVRQTFILSYTRYADDGKEQAPSLLISELFSYIDQAYQVDEGDQAISETLKYVHPYQAYHTQYFSNGKLKNYSFSDYSAACLYSQGIKKEPHQFIPTFQPKTSGNVPLSEACLSIQQIKQAISNPIKHYFNQTLGMYLHHEENEMACDEPFVVDSLQMHEFKKSSLKEPIHEFLKFQDKKGNLPLGLFKTTAVQNVQTTIQKYHTTLTSMSVNTKTIFEIKLQEHVEILSQNSQGWSLPPLEIPFQETRVKILGTFPEVSENGLMVNISGNKSDIIKAWAEFVILCYLIDLHHLPIKKQLLCTKSGKVKSAFFKDPGIELDQILDYYFFTLKNISPLTAEWLPHMMNEDSPESLRKNLEKSLDESFNPLYNPYIRWICKTTLPKTTDLLEHWQAKAQALFSPLYQSWIHDE